MKFIPLSLGSVVDKVLEVTDMNSVFIIIIIMMMMESVFL